jgi:hypothetical protein
MPSVPAVSSDPVTDGSSSPVGRRALSSSVRSGNGSGEGVKPEKAELVDMARKVWRGGSKEAEGRRGDSQTPLLFIYPLAKEKIGGSN